jgi:hypothetical protein
MRYGVILGLFALACGGGDDTSPTPTYADISGSFAGPISGTSEGVFLNATLTLTIAQNGASIAGYDAIVGTLGGIPISGSGTFAGTVTSGNNPSVNITNVQGCRSVQWTYSGSYDGANHRLTMTGPLYILDQDCSIVLTYSLTLLLSE